MADPAGGDTTRPICTTDEQSWQSVVDQDAQRELCVVMAFHPDTSRIGDLCRLSCGKSRVVIGRHFPRFLAGGTSGGRGIGDTTVSREAFSLEPDGTGWRLRREPGRSRLRINGQEISREKQLSETLLQQGLIVSLAQHVVLHIRLQDSASSLHNAPAILASLSGVSPAMQQLRKDAEIAAESADDVLLIGPTGTGKERIARAIHSLDQRHDGPWVAVNMAALPVEIASASLFGARKGAYTGADANRSGFFQQAHGGTLFLDEIADTPATLQPMLLRALQEREIQVVGGKPERVELRVIAAMEQDPDELRESFRPALRYRLGAQEIRLPALAERREDIALLAADLFRARMGSAGGSWSVSVNETGTGSWARLFEEFLAYAWPGNIRELQHTVAKIASCSRVRLQVPEAVKARMATPATVSAPSGLREPDQKSDLQVKEAPAHRLVDISDQEFMAAWESARYEVATIARQLGVSRSAIYRRLQSLRECRLAADVPLGEMLSALDSCRGDLTAAADRLAVSRRGLQTRLRASGVSSASLPDFLERKKSV